MAFLKTPNFGLTVDDIPHAGAPEGAFEEGAAGEENAADEEGPASRLTLHHLNIPQLGLIIPGLAPHNSDARQPQDTSEWPPVDLFYAAAAMNAWSPEAFIKYVRG